MTSSEETGGFGRISRRAFLGGAAGAAGLTLGGTASAYHGRYDTVIDVTEEGADNTGGESITPVLEDILDRHWDNLVLEFPSGEYYMDEQLRFTDFDRLALYGDDATIVPATGDEFEGPPRLFKLGTSDSPGGWLDMRNFTFDFTEPNTGLRAIQAQVEDVWIGNIYVRGTHDTGAWGPLHVDVLDPDATGLVSNVNIGWGAEYTAETPQDMDWTVDLGPTGFIVSPAHRGTLHVRDCIVGAYPDNGLYSSASDGAVHVEGGLFQNSNVANIRLDGDNSSVDGATIAVTRNRDRDGNQPGVRLDKGSGFEITDTEFYMTEAQGDAIRLTSAVESATIDGVDITYDHGPDWDDAISMGDGVGPLTISDTNIEMVAGGQAIQISDGPGAVELDDVTVTGPVSGANGGRHAIRINRDDTMIRDVVVEQPGDAYRRAIAVLGDGSTISGGRYESTHYPIVVSADDVEIEYTEARAYNGSGAIKLRDGYGGADIHHNVLYDGIENRGAWDVDVWDNEYPDS